MYAFITSYVCDNSIILIINCRLWGKFIQTHERKLREKVWYIGIHNGEFSNITLLTYSMEQSPS